MMSIIRAVGALTLAANFFLSGCANANEQEQYAEIAAELIHVTRAVEAEIRYVDPTSAELTDEALLEKSLADTPNWREPYEGYGMIARVIGGHAVVMVCTEDKTVGLLEDSGCTPAFDNYLAGSGGNACTPTFTPENVCAK